MRPINKGLQRLYEYLINTPLVMKSDDVRKAYEAFIAETTRLRDQLAQAQIRIREQDQDQAKNPSPAVDIAGAVVTLSQVL